MSRLLVFGVRKALITKKNTQLNYIHYYYFQKVNNIVCTTQISYVSYNYYFIFIVSNI